MKTQFSKLAAAQAAKKMSVAFRSIPIQGDFCREIKSSIGKFGDRPVAPCQNGKEDYLWPCTISPSEGGQGFQEASRNQEHPPAFDAAFLP